MMFNSQFPWLEDPDVSTSACRFGLHPKARIAASAAAGAEPAIMGIGQGIAVIIERV